MATKQFLFRLHHTPIEKEVNWEPPVYYTGSQTVQIKRAQCKLHYTDFLTSFPETTEDLSNQVNALVQAISCLQLKSVTVCVVVWELSDDRDADQFTPVVIFHPYHSHNCAPIIVDQNGDYEATHEYGVASFNPPNSNYDLSDSWFALYGSGYKSYDLCQNNNPGVQFDPYLACTEARDTATGRYKLAMHKRCVAPEDWYISYKRTLVLSTQGSLFRTRFPLYA